MPWLPPGMAAPARTSPLTMALTWHWHGGWCGAMAYIQAGVQQQGRVRSCTFTPSTSTSPAAANARLRPSVPHACVRLCAQHASSSQPLKLVPAPPWPVCCARVAGQHWRLLCSLRPVSRVDGSKIASAVPDSISTGAQAAAADGGDTFGLVLAPWWWRRQFWPHHGIARRQCASETIRSDHAEAGYQCIRHHSLRSDCAQIWRQHDLAVRTSQSWRSVPVAQ